MEKFEQLKKTLKTARQESYMFVQNGVRINEALWYHVSKEYPGEIGIHLFAMDIGKTFAESKVALGLYRQGLSELALRIETDPELADITQVSGWSKLVYEHPRLLTSLGFQVTKKDESKKEALAVMSREDFLKEYGKQG
ncbi:MAG: hypothetical protein AAB794_00490 [Patescibacteria group bacterium]